MRKPDSEQRGLAGEYYVAFILSCLGYDVSIPIGRAKVFDMTALSASGKAISIQVKANHHHYDWLVPPTFNPGRDSVVALVRLGKDPAQKPELYFLPGVRAKKLMTHKYKNHSPRISRADVRKEFQDHNFGLVERLLGKRDGNVKTPQKKTLAELP